MNLPTFPLSDSAKELVEFFLAFQTVEGFIEVFESIWQLEHGGKMLRMGAAYEQTEQQYVQLFSHRKYKDREVFYSARCRFYKETR